MCTHNRNVIRAKHATKAAPSSAYSVAKAALHGLTQQLAMVFVDDHSTVDAVLPAIRLTTIY